MWKFGLLRGVKDGMKFNRMMLGVFRCGEKQEKVMLGVLICMREKKTGK